MRRRWTVFLVLLKIAFASVIGSSSESETHETSLSYPHSKNLQRFDSLLPSIPKKDVAIVVDVDGKFYLVDTDSRKILWSWSSGLPIYSSYQNIPERGANSSEPVTDFYVDCGDDWQLYVYSNGTKQKGPLSAEDFVRSTPLILEDKGVTLGSRKTTVFLVNATSGKLVHTYKLPDSPSKLGAHKYPSNLLMLNENTEEFVEPVGEDLKSVERPLYIMRTDYALQHHSPVSGNVLWSVSFAEFDASYQFPGSGNELGSVMHKIKPAIVRIRDRSLKEPRSIVERIVNGLPAGKPLPLLAPENSLTPFVGEALVASGSSNHGEVHTGLKQLPWSAPENSLTPFVGEAIVASDIPKQREVPALPSPEIEDSGFLAVLSQTVFMSVIAEIIARYHLQFFIPFAPTVLFAAGIILYRYLASRRRGKLNKVAEELKVQPGAPKKKKNRKVGNKRTNVNNEKTRNQSSDELSRNETSEITPLSSFSNVADANIDGRKIGKLVVSCKEIAKGSNGTVVLEGIYDGRPVAVKRLVRTHHDVALKEIQNLIASDQHPNVVRWHGVENDQDFVYLSLERCTCSLNDLIYICSESFQSQVNNEDQESQLLNEYTLRMRKIKESTKDIELWNHDGRPTLQLLKLMRDVVSGIAHLHELGIIHRDLKPQNVLISKDKVLRAKLSDMGISKRLPGDMSSVTVNATGHGSSGWQAPEQLLRQRQTRAVDMFSLGCVLFFCVTGGKHPYGESIERDLNIVNDSKDLFLVENIPEAIDLFTRLLNFNPDMRPKAEAVLNHPFFWSPEIRLSFLRDASDRVELEDRENDSRLLDTLENVAEVALDGKWHEKMEAIFIANIGRYRRYNFESVRDLLRVIRNKLNHYRELPQEIQELLGPVPAGFDAYFSKLFPRLLIEVYNVMSIYCRNEEFFLKYTNNNLN